MSREITKEEVQEEFLSQIRALTHYWQNNKDAPTTKEKLDGLAFSFLCILDGVTSLPGFILAPYPHESDKEYHIDNGSNYYPENHNSTVECNIAGGLHDKFYE